MRIVVGADHAGFPLKRLVIEHLTGLGHEVTDAGTHGPEPVDFPDITAAVCRVIRDGMADRGLLLGGTGAGAAIAANKTPGIRAAVIHDIHSAHQCVEHDDVNVACVGAQIVGAEVAREVIAAFLAASFSVEEQFRRRVQKLHDLEKQSAREILDARPSA